MSLNNETIQHPLPGDLQSRVENALNLVTELESEHARLLKMIGSKKSEINALHEEKKDLESRIQSSQTVFAQLSSDITDRNVESTKVQYELDEKKKELEEVLKQKNDALHLIEVNKKDLLVRIDSVEEMEKKIDLRTKDLKLKEEDHEKRVGRLLEALK